MIYRTYQDVGGPRRFIEDAAKRPIFPEDCLQIVQCQTKQTR